MNRIKFIYRFDPNIIYIRIGRSVDPVIYGNSIELEIGKAIKIKEGSEAVIFATGVMVKDAIKAAGLLSRKNINVSLYSMHTIKPIDEELIVDCANKFNYMFTVEEHSKLGGLGAAVSDVLIDKCLNKDTRLIKMGFEDTFAPFAGSREYLNDYYGISPEKIAEKIEQTINA